MMAGAARGGDMPAPVSAVGQQELEQINSSPKEGVMIGGGTFTGDLRDLPQVPQRKRERPEREGPEPRPAVARGTVVGRGAGAAQPVPNPAGGPAPGAPAPAPSTSFEGLNRTAFGSGFPPDTNGDVGPNHFIETINTAVGIYSKTGTLLASFSFDTLMSQGAFGNLCDADNFGDPVVLYDTFEDRWVLSDFAFQLDGSGSVVNPPGVFECIAVSKTGDPVAGGWNFYSLNTTGAFGDYPKLGIWPDGIYISFNLFDYVAGANYHNVRLYALNKAQAYAGAPVVQTVSFDVAPEEFSLMPANARLQTGTPPVGSPNYFTSVWRWLDAVSVWKFKVDWTRISLSTLTGPTLSLTSTQWSQFTGASGRVPSSGGNALDTLYPRLMMQNQYSNIGGVESLWNSHTAGDGNPVSPTTSATASPRFYQVKVTGGTVEAAATQGFTYGPGGGLHRFMPSVAVNKNGDMAIGYNTSSSGTKPALVYAGRLAGDAANTISLTEQTLVAGAGTQVGNCGGGACGRWGDYATMTLDPDGCKFWFIGEYYQADGLDWNTRVGAFTFPGCVANTTATLSGVVKNSANLPLGGVTVALGSRTATTNASGVYSFAGLPAGTYPIVKASIQGYSTSQFTNVAVAGGGTTTRDFTLTPVAATSGCFVDTTQADFQADLVTNCDLTSTPGSVKLSNAVFVDQQNNSYGRLGFGFTQTAWAGQTFVPSVTGNVPRIDLFLFCASCSASTTTPSLTLSIRATTGNPALPTGADLASTTMTGFLSDFGVYYTATFSSPATLTAGTKYAMVIRSNAALTAGTYAYVVSGEVAPYPVLAWNPYTIGQRVTSSNSGSTWVADNTASGRDLAFKVYMDPGYYAAGSYISSVKDANPVVGGSTTWGNISWNATVPANTTLRFQVAASNNPEGPFNFVGPDNTAGTYFTSGQSLAQFNGKRYIRYKALLANTSNLVTPTLDDVSICFSNTPRPTLDLNGDGSGDVFTYNSASGAWKRAVAQGGGGFTEANGTWDPNWKILPTKFDSDSLTDMFLFNTTSGQWFKMLNDGANGFTTQATGFWWQGWQRYVMDLDGDGVSDIFLFDPVSGVWFKAISTPTGFTYLQGGWNPGWEIYPMTFNADAMGDMFLFDRTTGRWFWVLGAAGAGFTYPASEVWFNGWNLYPGDFNGDGLSDLLLHHPATGGYVVARTSGSSFVFTGGYWDLGWTPYVGDLNADRAQDLFLHSATTGRWFEMISDGAGQFTNAGGQAWSLGWNIYPTDFNADGRTDFMLYHPSTGVWYQARNLVLGTFSYSSGVWATNLTIVVRQPFF